MLFFQKWSWPRKKTKWRPFFKMADSWVTKFMHFLECMQKFTSIMISSVLADIYRNTLILSMKMVWCINRKGTKYVSQIKLTAILCKIKVIFRYERSILIHYCSLLMCRYMYNINLCRTMQIPAMKKKKKKFYSVIVYLVQRKCWTLLNGSVWSNDYFVTQVC